MRRTLLTLAATALLATGCGEGSPSSEPSLTEVPTTQATTPATEEPTTESTEPTEATEATTTDTAAGAPFTANTAEDTSEGSGDPVSVVDVRFESEEDFDRVVLETAGGGTPGWRATYVDEAVEQGRGNEVGLAGEGILEVLVTNTSYPSETGEEEYSGPERIQGGEVITETVFEGVYEGQTQVFIGTTSEQPFRVQARDDGTIVVEVWHEDVEG